MYTKKKSVLSRGKKIYQPHSDETLRNTIFMVFSFSICQFYYFYSFLNCFSMLRKNSSEK